MMYTGKYLAFDAITIDAITIRAVNKSMTRKKPANTDNDPDFRWFWDELDRYLASKKLKQTRQRRIIVQHFLELNTHVDAEVLYARTREAGHDFGLATIYRTLNLLTESGLAEQKSFTDGRSVFEVNLPDQHHDHLICLECGQVLEFENNEIEELQKKVAQKHGFELKSHRLDLFGKCLKKDCEYRPKRK